MPAVIKALFIFSVSLTCAHCNAIWDVSNKLNPVHGLYVKPSSDGTTGDLYVAATEDDGVKSQWLTDQPINFLPAASQPQAKAVPFSLTSSVTKTTSPNEETITSKKRAVITSPAVKYAYALPMSGAEGGFRAPYPYAIPTAVTADGSSSSIPTCSNDVPTHAYSPYHYFYPHMMTAIANAMNSVKESEGSDEASPATTPLTAPYWPHPYSYPYQYVMVDPNAWAQSQTNNLPSSNAGTSSGESA